jgi:tetratricopeptide (TPR) repeat protein
MGVDSEGSVTLLSRVLGIHPWGHLTELTDGSGASSSRVAQRGRTEPHGAPIAVATPNAKGPSHVSLEFTGPYADDVLGDFWCIVGDTNALPEGLPALDASGALVGLTVRIRATYDGVRKDTVAVVGDPFQVLETRGTLADFRASMFGADGPLALYRDRGLRQASADSRGDLVEAGLSRLRALVATHPRSALALMALAHAEARAGDATMAIEADRKAAMAYPCFRIPMLVEVPRARALVDAAGRDARKAMSAFAAAEGVWYGVPSSEEASITYALACTRTDRYLRARRILELVPPGTSSACLARVELATAIETQGLPLDTEPLWRAAVAAKTACPDAEMGLLSALEQRGRLTELVARMDATLGVWRSEESQVARVLRCAIRAGDAAESVRWLSAWAATNPRPSTYALQASRVDLLQGRVGAAAELLERAASLGRDDSQLLADVIVELVKLGRFESADRHLRRLGELDPARSRDLQRELDRRRGSR